MSRSIASCIPIYSAAATDVCQTQTITVASSITSGIASTIASSIDIASDIGWV